MVDGQRLPVRLAHDEPPAGAQHAVELPERLGRVGDVLQYAVGAGAVGGAVGQRQVVDVAESHGDGVPVGSAFPGGVDRGRVVVDTDHRARPGDRSGERGEIGAGAAPQIEHRLARAEVEFVEHPPFAGAAEVGRGYPVEVADRVGGGGLERC